MSGHWGKLHPGGVGWGGRAAGGWLRKGWGEKEKKNHKDKIDSFLAHKKLASAKKLRLRVKTSIIQHKDGLYGTLWCPPSPPICLSCHFYFSSLYFILSSPPSPSIPRLSQDKVHRRCHPFAAALRHRKSALCRQERAYKIWRKGNTGGQLIFCRVSGRGGELERAWLTLGQLRPFLRNR